MGKEIAVLRFDSATRLFQYLTDHFLTAAKRAIDKNGQFNVALSGGSTPIPFFKMLSLKRDELDWSRVNFFWVDERWVPHNHPESNYGTAMRSGLNKLHGNFFPFNTTSGSPEEACYEYSNSVHTALGIHEIDFILLGAGVDGHTASVFEGDMNNKSQKGFAFVTSHSKSGQTRLSLSLSSIIKSREICVLLIGNEKKKVLKSIQSPTDRPLPIQWVALNSINGWVATDIQDL
jgi:6-phosphogluconolactonase